MPRAIVITDRDGNIKAATRVGPPTGESASGTESVMVELAPEPGEAVHDLALPGELHEAGSLGSLGDYRVEVSGGEARLVRRDTRD
ncbi:hypothetical protein GCM10018790_81060 [Kitasatospora xanthocidica]|nr:hypothetical protein GCM10018790_81060 [Kitasatospora xanthocidica]